MSALTVARRPGLLVVDDNADALALMGVLLPGLGFAVWLAGGGREALQVYSHHGHEIDLVLLDVLMPELDGPQTLEALRAVNPQLRHLYMSGYTDGRLGGCQVIQKPFRFDELGEAVRLALATSTPRGRDQ